MVPASCLKKTWLFFISWFVALHTLMAQTVDPALLSSLQWRCIGPYRGGRTCSAAGSASQPNVFYVGAVDGGIWKTDDYGRTWKPVFDHEPTGSIGSLAESPSNPDILYAGSGEGLHRPDLSTGDGIYKTENGGRSWTHLGLRDGQQIPSIAIDPQDPSRLFVAVLGHPYGPNAQRGVYRSTDGGKSFQQVLYVDENTGADQVLLDPQNSSVVFATLWKSREGPWENGAWDGFGGVFKSTDGGTTWKKIGKGLPGNGDSLTQVHLAIAASQPSRMYAAVAYGRKLGIFRSDDGGSTWNRITRDPLPADRIGGGDLPVLAVDPKNPNLVYSTSIVMWKSLDGGKTWTGFRGAPGGDDYQNVWINPVNPDILLVVSDQGAIITVNSGKSWSSWYTQPTAQLYHVEADNAFPYNLYSGQQESGSVGIASRSNDGEITDREWHPVGAEEYGYVAPDPLNPDIVYGGKVSRYDKRTGQVQDVSPGAVHGGKYRFLRTAPLLFSPLDPHSLYLGGNVLFKTQDEGHSWQVISPDLTRNTWNIPPSVGIYRTKQMEHMPRRGVIYTVAPSPLEEHLIWAGTDDGLIQVTRDGGKHWTNVTPPEIHSWNKVSLIDAGHFDPQTAYAAVNNIRVDDQRPHIFRTHDGGKTWTPIVQGLPDEPVNAVREDPVSKGLLYASTETAVYVSFDDGEHWQSLRLNMPATSVRDIMIKDNDLVAATHGRGFWILDDITPLRHISGIHGEENYLYPPADAVRVRWDMNTDTPLPPDEPAGQNPPDGAILDYFLNDHVEGKISLEITGASGKLIRVYSSADTLAAIPHVNIPLYWIRPQQILSAAPGEHRFIWDLHEQPLNIPANYSIGAVYHNTPAEPSSPWVMPGIYTITLKVQGKSYSRKIKVDMDPRVKTPVADLQLQFNLSQSCYQHRLNIMTALHQLQSFRSQINAYPHAISPDLSDSLIVLDQLAEWLETGHRVGNPGFNLLERELAYIQNQLQGADRRPTVSMVRGLNKALSSFRILWKSWKNLNNRVVRINSRLQQTNQPILHLADNP